MTLKFNSVLAVVNFFKQSAVVDELMERKILATVLKNNYCHPYRGQ